MNPNELRKDRDHHIPNTVELIVLKYDECCLWGNSSVTICEGTSRRKTSLLF